MAYNGSVELISGIKQKNNGNFPLVDASDVQVTDSQRLNAKLTELDSAIDNRLQVDDAQDLTDEQKAMARENIGIVMRVTGTTLVLEG